MKETNKQAEGARSDLAVVQRESSGLQLTTLDSIRALARYILKAGIWPAGANKSGDFESAEAQVVVAIAYGMEVGLPPICAAQQVAVINGRACVWGDAMLALCMRSPYWDNMLDERIEGEGENTTAYCTVKRKGMKPVTRSFSAKEARQAGLLDKQAWKTYPRRMLQMRARAFALRDTFPDVLRGLYAAEELAGGEPFGHGVTREVAVSVEVADTAQSAQPGEPPCAQRRKAQIVEALGSRLAESQ